MMRPSWRCSGLLALVVVLFLLDAMVPSARAAGEAVITWGADLSNRDRAKVRRIMQIQQHSGPLWELQVTNSEEQALLGNSVPASYLGTRAISSAYVRPLEPGSGLQVTTHNITWVSRRMFAQALITGGVRDAEVIVAAPAPVSGTAALTGIFKAFEAAADADLPEQGKRIAGEELYVTREVGENVGHEQASDLMERVKEELVGQKFTDKTAIIDLIRKSALEMGIELSPADVQQIADLMAKINSLDLKQNDLQIQLDKMSGRVDRLLGTQMGLKDTITSWFQRLVDLIARLLDQFMSFVAGARP